LKDKILLQKIVKITFNTHVGCFAARHPFNSFVKVFETFMFTRHHHEPTFARETQFYMKVRWNSSVPSSKGSDFTCQGPKSNECPEKNYLAMEKPWLENSCQRFTMKNWWNCPFQTNNSFWGATIFLGKISQIFISMNWDTI
jgi:hypothetical protein